MCHKVTHLASIYQREVKMESIQYDTNHLVQDYKNIERHTVHTIASWRNPEQWEMGHTSHLMVIIR